jgi:hypothetical protein
MYGKQGALVPEGRGAMISLPPYFFKLKLNKKKRK